MFQNSNNTNSNNSNNNNPNLNNGEIIDNKHESFNQLSLTEAVYKAFGETYFEICPQLNVFNMDFSNDIGGLVTHDINFINCPFIVDRVTWLIGKLTEEMNKIGKLSKIACELLLSGLSCSQNVNVNNNNNYNNNNNNNLIIRLNAACSLGSIIDDRAFELEFSSYFKASCIFLLELINDSSSMLNDSDYALSTMSHMMAMLHIVNKHYNSSLFQPQEQQGEVTANTHLIGTNSFVIKYKEMISDSILTVVIGLERIEMDAHIQSDSGEFDDFDYNNDMQKAIQITFTQLSQDARKSNDVWRTLTYLLANVLSLFPNDCHKFLMDTFENSMQQITNLVIILKRDPNKNHLPKIIRLTKGTLVN